MELQAVRSEAYVIIVMALALVALIAVGATPRDIRAYLDHGGSGYRLHPASPPEEIPQ